MKLRFSGEKYTQAIFGFLGMVASLDLARSSEGTKELLGWKPVQFGLLEDLEQGHYFTSLIFTRTSRIHFSSGLAK
ncbi:hypothetical protein [Paenibacillus sp. O199]|uniref:hypothetical protein n=1 Tax=Paenibacillus sp. O199 TaxID=1643925 RepID=UPI000A74A0BA|nr:hypothetical protein [Paenibacillus sp. O199]